MAGFLSRVPTDAEFAARKLALVPSVLRADAESAYRRRYAENSQQGNLWLLALSEFAEKHGGGDLAASDRDICTRAAMLAQSPMAAAGRSEAQIRRELRRKQWRGIEKLAYKIGVVGKGRQEYVSTQTLCRRTQQKARWQRFADTSSLTHGDKRVKLSTIIADSAQRRSAELYHLSKSLQTVAEQDGLHWSMWTLTAPPEFHPAPSHGKSSWNDQTDPRQAHDYIAVRWQRVRAKLEAHGIKLSGVRVTEPHKDGCAHWHLAVFYNPDDHAAIHAAFRSYWPTESGAQEVVGDPAKGAFASYIFKYISKAIYSDDNAENATCKAADAWRSTWGVRAFQFFGLPPLTLWRELRKLETAPASDDSVTCSLWRAARRTDGAAFIRLAGGLAASRQRFRLRTTDDNQKTIIDRETGEESPLPVRQKWTLQVEPRATFTVILSYPREATPAGAAGKNRIEKSVKNARRLASPGRALHTPDLPQALNGDQAHQWDKPPPSHPFLLRKTAASTGAH